MSSAECYPEKAHRVNAILDVLAHHLRREVIHYFENCTDSSTAALDKVVDHIATRVPDCDHEELTAALFHVHLPRLEREGWIEFDQRSNEIRYYGVDAVPQLLQEVTAIFTD